MPPKSKNTGGKEGSKPADIGEKDLAFFQNEFVKFKQGPDAYMRKGGGYVELEKCINNNSNPLNATGRLARLCRARIQFELVCNDMKKYISEREDAEKRLELLLESPPRSLTAICLLVAFHDKAAGKGGDAASVAKDNLDILRSKYRLLHELKEDDWTDPADEVINKGGKDPFVVVTEGGTKMERLMQLRKYLDGKYESTKKMVEEQRSTAQKHEQQRMDRHELSRDFKQLIAQPQQQQLSEEKAQEKAAADAAASQRNETWKNEAWRLGVERERIRVMEVLDDTLREAGREGSLERARALCDLFALDFMEFEAQMRKALDAWLQANNLQSQPQIKAFYLQQLQQQMARFRGAGLLLQLQPTDLKEMLEQTYKFGVADVAALAGQAAGGKDDKGDVVGGGAKAGAGKKGGKAGTKDQNKGVAAQAQAAAGAVAATSWANAAEFLTWFANTLKEQEADIRQVVFDAAWEAIKGKKSGHEEGFLAKLKDAGPGLADVLQLHWDDETTRSAPEQQNGLSFDIANRARLGEQLIKGPVATEESWAAIPKDEKAKKIDSETKHRLRFATSLMEIPVLQRYDVLSALASRLAIMASIAPQPGGDSSKFFVYPDIFTPVDSAKRVLQTLGDPTAVLQGYAHILRHRGLLPLGAKVLRVDETTSGLDETDVRLLRLCDWVLQAKQSEGSEVISLVLVLFESINPDHVEVVRRLCGELPQAVAERLKRKQETAAEAASGELPNGNGAVEANGGAPSDVEAGEGEAAADGGEEDDEDLLFGPCLAFETRDLPAAERAALSERWRQDIVDTVTAMQEGSCGLGRRLSCAISSFIAEALGTEHACAVITAESLRGLVGRLGTEPLLHLRFFLLSQLALRMDATTTGIQDRLEEWERLAQEEMWSVELVPGAGPAVEKVRLSERAFWRLNQRSQYARRRHIIRLQCLHAMKRKLNESKDASCAGATGAAASTSNASSAPSGGGKKKGKGGGAGGAAGSAAAASAAMDVDMKTLPALPPGVLELEEDQFDLFDVYSAKDLSEEALRELMSYGDIVCEREAFEILRIILDPQDTDAQIGAVAAEAAVVEEVLDMGTQTLFTASIDSAPPFTVREVVEELLRASIIEGVRQEAVRHLQNEVDGLLKSWRGLMQEFKERGELEQFIGELKPHVSEWLYELLKQVGADIGGTDAVREHASMADRLGRVEATRRRLTSQAFMLQSRVARVSVLSHAARRKASNAIEEKLRGLPDKIINKEPVKEASKEAGKETGKKGKARQTQEIPNKRADDLQYEHKMAKAEMEFLSLVLSNAISHADDCLATADIAASGYGAGSRNTAYPQGLRPIGFGERPRAAAKVVLMALEAAQHLAFIVLIVETAIDEVLVQARAQLGMALTNEPLMDPGVVGTLIPLQWMRDRLLEVVLRMDQDKLVELEAKEKKKAQEEKEAKEAKERERKLAEQRKRDEERKKEEEEETRRRAADAEEARKRKEREDQEALERKQDEERQKEQRAREKAAQEEAKRMSSSLLSEYTIDLEELKAEDAADEAKAAAEAKAKAQQPAAKAGGDAHGNGKKDGMAVRIKEQQQKQPAPQQPHGPAEARGRRDGGAGPSGAPTGSGSAKNEQGQRKGGPGQLPHQQHASQGAVQGRLRDGGSAPVATAAAAAASVSSAGKDSKGGQAPSGKADRMGGQAAQPQSQGGKGGQGGKIAGGVGQGGGSGAKAAAATRTVPGLDPEMLRQGTTSDSKSKGGRKRRGGGGGGDTAAAAGAAAAGRMAPDVGAFSGGEHPHPPAAGILARTEGEEMALVNLTEEGGGAADGDAVGVPEYPYKVPFPCAAPEGCKVYRGVLLPEDVYVDIEQAAKAHGIHKEPELRNFRKLFPMFAAVDNFKSRGGFPQVPPEAYKDSMLPGTQRHQQQLPYAVPVDLPSEYHQQEQAAAAPGAPPQSPYDAGPSSPPYGPHGPPMAWPPFSSVPPTMPPFGQPQFTRPPGPIPPFPGAPPTIFSYGAQQPALRPPPVPAMAGPPAPHEESDNDEHEDTDDLLGLLGVQSQAPRPAAGPAAPPAAAPMPPTPSFPPFTPVLQPSYGGGYPLALQASYGARPPATPAPALDVDTDTGEELPPPPTAAPYTPHVPPPPQARPAPSWADRAKAGASAASAARAMASIGRPAPPRPRPHGTEEEFPDSDEIELQSGMFLSMRDNMNVAFPPLGAAAANASARAATAASAAAAAATGASANQEQQLALVSSGAVGTGLINRVGEYNCFLNVIIQCLWHCAAFRQELQARSPDDFQEQHPVVAALLRLFHALDAADAVREQQRQQLLHSEVAAERHVVDPSELREALDALGVRAGEMNDASEVLSALFESLNRAPGLAPGAAAGALSVVDRTFGLLLSEEVRCTVTSCGRITHVVPQHVEYTLIITATGLRDMRAVIEGSNVSMGRIVCEIEAQNVKRCDKDPPHHGCNTFTRVTRTLHNVPAVLTILMVWEPDVQGDAIAGTMTLVDTVLDPKEIFSGGNCQPGTPSYALHGMFCYYGQHYFAFINRGPVEPTSAQEWVMFDDATVAAVGNWQAVINKCRAGRIQPSVLFYQQHR